MANIYRASNGAAQTTAAKASVATGTAIKTLLQLSPPSTLQLRIKAWGISFDGSAAATPGKVELIETDVAATSLTAYNAADITKLTNPGEIATALTLGASNSGFTAGTEGTTTASRTFDEQLIAPTNQYAYQFPLGQEPVVQASKFLRIRVTFGTTVNAYCWVVWEE